MKLSSAAIIGGALRVNICELRPAAHVGDVVVKKIKKNCIQRPRLRSTVVDSFARCCFHHVRGFVFGPCLVISFLISFLVEREREREREALTCFLRAAILGIFVQNYYKFGTVAQI